MLKIAIIKTGGKQYVVKEKDRLKVEKLKANAGDELDLETLLLANEDGSDVAIGQPVLPAKVKAKVSASSLGKLSNRLEFEEYLYSVSSSS